MAWMFAGTEQDLCVGIHFHTHGPVIPPPPPAGPLPGPIPSIHPAIGPIRDKLARTVTVDGRKAAKTGSIAKILMPPHLPICYIAYWGIGPMMAGPKDGTGIDQILFGAGIGAHPIGGVMFVVIEGKPAAGFLCQSLSCTNIAGFEMMVPTLPNLLLVPTRGISVFYGIAPLAIDLCVLLVAIVQALLDYVVSLVPEGLLQDLAQAAADGVVAGLETFLEARFERDPPASTADALREAGRTAAYTFVDGATEALAGAATEALGDRIAGPEWTPTRFIWDAVVADRVESGLTDLGRAGVDRLTGGDYSAWQQEQKARAEAERATAPDPLGQITRPMETVGEVANDAAGLAATAHQASTGDVEAMDELQGEAWSRSTEAAGQAFNAVTGLGEQEEEPFVQTEAHDQTTAPEFPVTSDSELPSSLDFGGGGDGGGDGGAPMTPGQASQEAHLTLQAQEELDRQRESEAAIPTIQGGTRQGGGLSDMMLV